MNIDMELSLFTLFTSAFISSTLAPGGSEVILALMASQPGASLILLISVAAIGNTLGALTTFGLGALVSRKAPFYESLSKKYKISIERLNRFGPWVLLFSWLPIVGDALCFAAGWIRVNFAVALFAIAVGKVFRYAVIATLAAG